ncbi:MAG: glycerate kinase, partial [Candidatus Hydrogenedentota bacterium]
MRVVIAPDSFKECASASVVAQAISWGVRGVLPEAAIVCVPMADGGEGTLDAVLSAIEGRRVRAQCRGPLGEAREAEYGLFEGGRTALVEMAAACGLALVPREKRNPGATTTLGLGDLIRHALDRGVDRVIIGLGGSATNDAGAGMARALGYRLLDGGGRELGVGGLALHGLARIDATNAHPRIREVAFVGACDVTNRLCGPRGASFMYGAQKGADAKMMAELEH